MNNKVWLKVPSPATGNKAWLNFPPPAGRATAAGPVRPPVADPAPPASHSHSPPQHAPLPPTLLTACPPSGQSHTPRGSPASRVHRCGTRPPPFHSLPPFWTKPYAKWKSCQLCPPLRYPPPPLHSLPPFWAKPYAKWKSCQPCPPLRYTPALTIGRAMVESDV